jgi:hypothetical protein
MKAMHVTFREFYQVFRFCFFFHVCRYSRWLIWGKKWHYEVW